MDERFNQLKKRFRFHSRIASELGVDRRTYFNYRKGSIPKRVSRMIDLLLENGNDQPIPSPSQPEPELRQTADK